MFLDYSRLEKVHVLLFVDYIMFVGKSIIKIKELKCSLKIEFKIDDYGVLNYYLGIKNIDTVKFKRSQGLKNMLQHNSL